MLKGGDTGPAIVPGKPEASLLVRALQYEEGADLHMPPKAKLPEAVIADFVKWIAAGAVYPTVILKNAVSSGKRDREARTSRPEVEFVHRLWPHRA